MTDAEALDMCIKAMKHVTYCFNSIHSDNINETQPSCKGYLLSIINKVENR